MKKYIVIHPANDRYYAAEGEAGALATWDDPYDARAAGGAGALIVSIEPRPPEPCGIPGGSAKARLKHAFLHDQLLWGTDSDRDVSADGSIRVSMLAAITDRRFAQPDELDQSVIPRWVAQALRWISFKVSDDNSRVQLYYQIERVADDLRGIDPGDDAGGLRACLLLFAERMKCSDSFIAALTACSANQLSALPLGNADGAVARFERHAAEALALQLMHGRDNDDVVFINKSFRGAAEVLTGDEALDVAQGLAQVLRRVCERRG